MLLLALLFAGSGFAQTPEDGLAAMQLEEWDKAIEIYSALVKKDPTDQPSWLTLGSAYLAKGEKDKAKNTFDAAFNAKSEGAYAMIATGRILLLQGNVGEADKIFSKAKKYGKKDIVAKRLIGESFLFKLPEPGVKPNFTRAEEELKEAMDLSSKDFPTLMALAYCYKEMPNGGLAAQHYEYAINVEPKNPLPVFMLAKVYRAAKIYDKFLQNVDKAIALNPSYTVALRAKAEYLYYDKKWEKATEAAKALINNGKTITIEDEMLLANLLYITKDCKGCSEMVDRILKQDGSKNYLRRLQAYCNYDNGKYPEGLNILEEFFKQVAPDKILPSDYEYLARLQINNGRDTAVAVSNFIKAIELDTSKWPLYDEIGQLYYNAKDYCNAAVAYQMYLDSLKETQSIVNTSYRLGLCYYFCTDDSLHFVKAEKAFTKLTEMVPDASVGWLWLAKSAKNRDPDIVANPELIDSFGVAMPYFAKYAEIAGEEAEKNKRDLIPAYEYLSFYHFSRNEDEKAMAFLDKLLAINPENESAQKMKETILNGGSAAPDAPKGNGKGKP